MARGRVLEPMHGGHVNVTPLIDVILCLIIFFLVVGHLAQSITHNGVVLPRAERGAEMLDRDGRLPINLVATGGSGEPELWVGGQRRAMSELGPLLRREKTADSRIVVRADGAVTYQWIAPVLVACAKENIKNVSFATRQN